MAQFADVFRVPSTFGAGHELITCVDVYSGRSLRLVLRRQRGDFSERDRDVLSLLRPHFASIYRDLRRRRSGSPNLTIRQWDVLRLVADGASNAEIAKQLCLSEGTVHKHLENIFRRLSVTSRTAAIALVIPDLRHD